MDSGNHAAWDSWHQNVFPSNIRDYSGNTDHPLPMHLDSSLSEYVRAGGTGRVGTAILEDNGGVSRGDSVIDSSVRRAGRVHRRHVLLRGGSKACHGACKDTVVIVQAYKFDPSSEDKYSNGQKSLSQSRSSLPKSNPKSGSNLETVVQLQVLFILTRELFARNFLILPHLL